MVVSVKDDQLLFDQDVAATWTDDVSKSCKVELSLIPDGGQSKTINSGDKLEEAGKLTIQVTDEAGNSSSAEIKLTLSDTKAPEITLVIQEKNVVAGVIVSIQDNQLLFDDQVAATWADDYSETFTIELTLTPESGQSKTLKSGDNLLDAGKLTILVADDSNNKATAEITLTAVAIYGLENLQDKTLQVDQETNLLEGLTLADGLTLKKVDVVQDGVRRTIENPQSISFEYPCSIDVILTVARGNGAEIIVCVNGLAVKALEYNAVSMTTLNPAEILPVIGQVENGDVNAYAHIDHLKIAEATRIIEMMWEYGTSKHSPEQYQQLMGRLNTGIRAEVPF